MRQALVLAGIGLLVGTAVAPVQAQSAAFPGNQRLTARAVSGGAVRSNTLLPLGGSEVIDNPVPSDLQNLSGWSQGDMNAALQKEYAVDVVAVANYLYSPAGIAFLTQSVGGNNYTPYYSQTNQVQAVRSAIILNAASGKLSGYGMMAKLPTDQRLHGPMNNCIGSGSNAQQTSLLGWYATTPACIQQRTAQAASAVSSPGMPAQPGAVRGLW